MRHREANVLLILALVALVAVAGAYAADCDDHGTHAHPCLFPVMLAAGAALPLVALQRWSVPAPVFGRYVAASELTTPPPRG